VLRLSIDQKNYKKVILEPNANFLKLKKIGDEFYTFLTGCEDPKACSILLRGSSKDVLNEMERNLHDCLAVAKNIFVNPKLVPGGGAIEMEVSSRLDKIATQVEGLA